MDQVRAFVEGTAQVQFAAPDGQQRRVFISETLAQFRYFGLDRKDRGLVLRYLLRVTGYSRQQLTRLVAQQRRTGRLTDRRGAPARPFVTRYTAGDAALLAELDQAHGTLSGPATRKLCERAFRVFGDQRFERLAGISVSHLYNLRRSTAYVRRRGPVHKTQPVHIAIGERRVPRPQGRPGYLRLDSVHSGDFDGVKGLYLINAVDEVTQFQQVAAVPRLAEQYMLPALEGLLAAFPFTILGLHSDNGSEFINHEVARLARALSAQFTKSRPRRSNDNALVESKNGTTLRKHLGHAHIPASAAEALNGLLRNQLCPYLNFHRPCFFPLLELDAKGRQRKRYRYEDLMTPYDKLKSLPGAEAYLKPGLSWSALDRLACRIDDTEAARSFTRARHQLFGTLFGKRGVA